MRAIVVFALVSSGVIVVPACSDSSEESGTGGTGGVAGATGGSAGNSLDASDAGAGGMDASDDAASGLKGTVGVECGSSTCDTKSEVCCQKAQSTFGCETPNDASAPCSDADGGVGTAHWCDDSFDCASGDICCRHREGNDQACAPAGSCDGREVCQPGSDCATAGLMCITNSYGFSVCANPSPSVPCGGATCTGTNICCVHSQTAACMSDQACQAAGGQRYFCTDPGDCAGGMHCCAAPADPFAGCFFECGDPVPDVLCAGDGDCPTNAPNCTAAQEYFDGAKHCTP